MLPALAIDGGPATNLEEPRLRMCGIVGIVSTEPVNQQIYDSLLLLQHRGQDSTGIATAEGATFHVAKASGQVREAFRTRDMRSLLGNVGLGHVRYATKGAAEREEEAQPFYVNAPYGIILVHNGNLTNTRELSDDLFRIDRRHVNSASDTEMLLNVLATELQGQVTGYDLDPDQVFRAVSQVHERVGLRHRDAASASLARPTDACSEHQSSIRRARLKRSGRPMPGRCVRSGGWCAA